jgi:hypothetical protein
MIASEIILILLDETNNDPLMQESMKALNESTDQHERLKKEINENEKNIKLCETMRSAYDVNKT